MEATTGLGFRNIIDNDFKTIGDDRHKQFLVIVGLASIHRSTLSSNIVGSALSNLGIAEGINVMSRETEGIVVTNTKKYSVRHPVYVRELFEKIVPTAMIRDCIVAVLEAFSDYETPVIKNVSKSDGVVFRSIINHRFVKEMMRNDEDKVRSVYEVFETNYTSTVFIGCNMALRYAPSASTIRRWTNSRQPAHPLARNRGKWQWHDYEFVSN